MFICIAVIPSPSAAQRPEPQFDATGHPVIPATELFEKVEVNSLATSAKDSSKQELVTGYLLKAKGQGKAPGAVLHPACEGLISDGQVKLKYARMGRYLNAGGFTVLLIDGFNPRGFSEVCSPAGVKAVDHLTRLILRLKWEGLCSGV